MFWSPNLQKDQRIITLYSEGFPNMPNTVLIKRKDTKRNFKNAFLDVKALTILLGTQLLYTNGTLKEENRNI